MFESLDLERVSELLTHVGNLAVTDDWPLPPEKTIAVNNQEKGDISIEQIVDLILQKLPEEKRETLVPSLRGKSWRTIARDQGLQGDFAPFRAWQKVHTIMDNCRDNDSTRHIAWTYLFPEKYAHEDVLAVVREKIETGEERTSRYKLQSAA